MNKEINKKNNKSLSFASQNETLFNKLDKIFLKPWFFILIVSLLGGGPF